MRMQRNQFHRRRVWLIRLIVAALFLPASTSINPQDSLDQRFLQTNGYANIFAAHKTKSGKDVKSGKDTKHIYTFPPTFAKGKGKGSTASPLYHSKTSKSEKKKSSKSQSGGKGKGNVPSSHPSAANGKGGPWTNSPTLSKGKGATPVPSYSKGKGVTPVPYSKGKGVSVRPPIVHESQKKSKETKSMRHHKLVHTPSPISKGKGKGAPIAAPIRVQPIPTVFPTDSPTPRPFSLPPTNVPTESPTELPTKSPVELLSQSPSDLPSSMPSLRPSTSPSTSNPTVSPSTAAPTEACTEVSSAYGTLFTLPDGAADPEVLEYDNTALVTIDYTSQFLRDSFRGNSSVGFRSWSFAYEFDAILSPLHIDFVWTLTFDCASVIPTTDDIDALIRSSLEEPNLAVLLTQLQQDLNPSNPFSETTFAEYVDPLFLPLSNNSSLTTTEFSSPTIASNNQPNVYPVASPTQKGQQQEQIPAPTTGDVFNNTASLATTLVLEYNLVQNNQNTDLEESHVDITVQLMEDYLDRFLREQWIARSTTSFVELDIHATDVRHIFSIARIHFDVKVFFDPTQPDQSLVDRLIYYAFLDPFVEDLIEALHQQLPSSNPFSKTIAVRVQDSKSSLFDDMVQASSSSNSSRDDRGILLVSLTAAMSVGVCFLLVFWFRKRSRRRHRAKNGTKDQASHLMTYRDENYLQHFDSDNKSRLGDVSTSIIYEEDSDDDDDDDDEREEHY